MVRDGWKSVPALRVGLLPALKFEGEDGLTVAVGSVSNPTGVDALGASAIKTAVDADAVAGAGFAAPGCDSGIPVSLRRETDRAEFGGMAAGVALGPAPVRSPAVALALAPTLALAIPSALARARGGAVI